MADYEIYLEAQPDDTWKIVGHGVRGGDRMGAALILEGAHKDVTDAILGKLEVKQLPAFYHVRLKIKGFVGITMQELKKVLK